VTERTETPAPPPSDSAGIDPYEKNWMRFSVVLLVVFAAAVALSGFALGFQVPGEDQEVDPTTVADSGPWANPGLREIGDGEYEVYMLARTWLFEPRELEIPVGAKVTFYVTSVDVQHGFKIQDTNVNMQIVPGQVSKLSYTFGRVGEYPFICHEYCGAGHAAMFGTIRVVQETGGSA
jgi:cytochrome c oxidase subunit 2